MRTVDLRTLDGLEEAGRDGAFYLVHHGFDQARALRAARAFFELPLDDKLAIRQNRSFRGYSEMRGVRDCREQIHFGPESAIEDGLRGPNLWPRALGNTWRDEILAMMRQLGAIGRRLLPQSGDPHLLLKLIHYPVADQVGVAPHCDFSWLTLLIQDGPGLSIEDADGNWHEAPPRDDALVVDIGELCEYQTRGRWRAAPHRVQAPASRLSLPLFVNPPLNAVIEGGGYHRQGRDHVHRVLPPRSPSGRLVFGEAEWRRKGLGQWCYDPACLSSTTVGSPAEIKRSTARATRST